MSEQFMYVLFSLGFAAVPPAVYWLGSGSRFARAVLVAIGVWAATVAIAMSATLRSVATDVFGLSPMSPWLDGVTPNALTWLYILWRMWFVDQPASRGNARAW